MADIWSDPQADNITLKTGINNGPDDDIIYFITNHEGESVELDYNRKNNKCQCREHEEYTVYQIDKDTGEIKKYKKNINDKEIKVYYYDIMKRAREYAATSGITIMRETYNGAAASAAFLVGGGVGSVVDFFVALRFIFLPEISPNDLDYHYYTEAVFDTCAHESISPTVLIVSYPDITFSLKIGLFATTQTLSKNDGNVVEKDPFSIDFKIQYGNQTKTLSYDYEVKTENKKLSDGAIMFNTVKKLIKLFREVRKTSKKLKETVKLEPKGGVTKALFGKYDWLEGELSLEPELSWKWKYATSEDLKAIGAEHDISLGFDASGKLTIDLLILALNVMKITTTAATGGIAALVIKVIECLLKVVKWIVDTFGDENNNCDYYFDLIFTVSAGVTIEGCYNTVAKHNWTGSNLELEIGVEVEFKVGFEYKTTMIMDIKGVAVGGCKIGGKYKPGFVIDDGDLFFKHGVYGDPFTVYVELSISGSFSKKKKKKESKDKTVTTAQKIKGKDGYKKEWEFGGWEWESEKYRLTKNNVKGKRFA